MTLPTYAEIERAIRSAWSGDVATATAIAGDDAELVKSLELLAAAPFAYKNVSASGVRTAWVRAGGVTPVTGRGSISDPVGAIRAPSI